MSKKYAIRLNELGYDEFFIRDWVINSNVIQQFDEKNDAESVYKTLVANAIRTEGFDNYDIGNGKADKTVYEVINNFTEVKLGKIYDSVKDIEFNKLTDDELLELAQAVHLNLYELIQINENKNFYTFWLNNYNGYLRTEYEKNIVSGTYENFLTDDPSARELCRLVDFLNEKPPMGTLPKLSHNPETLRNTLDNQTTVLYIDNKLVIREDNYWIWQNAENGLNELKSINSILKKPWFEIRKLSLDELEHLQNENT